MGLLTWLRSWKIIENRNVSGRRKPAGQRRLAIEILEDRMMPSTLPGLGFSTYLNDTKDINGASANAVAVDGAGNTYVAGSTDLTAFVTVLHPDGSLVYAKELRGSNSAFGLALAVDNAGDAYIFGGTSSADFPTKNAFQSTFGSGTMDCFLTKLDPNGAILYSTFLAGAGSPALAHAGGVAVDNAGNAYVANYAGLVTKIDTNLSGSASLVYSTVVPALVRGIALDSSGDAYVTGTAHAGFTTTPGAFMTSGSSFVTKLSADGAGVAYSTFINTGLDSAWAIAVDGAGNAAVTGQAGGGISMVPTTPGAFEPVRQGAGAFMTEVNATGSGLVYSTYLGASGSSSATGYGIATDSAGRIFLTGDTGYAFPTKNAIQPAISASADAFVTEFDPTQSGEASLVFSTFLGGSSADWGYSIAVDGSDNIYVAGKTSSQDFPTANAYEPACTGNYAGFVTKILTPPATVATMVTLAASANPATVGQPLTLTATVTPQVAGSGVPSGTVTFYSGIYAIGSAVADSTGVATFVYLPQAGGSYSVHAIYSGSATLGERSTAFITEMVNGTQADTITLKSSASSPVYGQTVTFTATVKAASGTVVPTGTVTFMDGATVVGTGTLSSGVATLATSALTVGSHAVTAVYGGDSTFAANTSSALSQTVKQAATKTTVASSLTSAPLGQPVTFTVTVAPVAPGAGTPTGTITIMDGTTVLGTATLINGKATFTTSILPKGKHTITAIYNSDVDFLTSTSSSLTETIN